VQNACDRDNIMNMSKKYLLNILWFSIILISCTNESHKIEPAPITFTNTMTATLINTPTGTQVYIPIETKTVVVPTVKIKQEITPLWNSCINSTDEKYDCINQLLINNNGCDFPCWWGIDPGKTAITSVYNQLSNFGSNNKIDLSEDNMELLFPFENDDLYATLNINGENSSIIKMRLILFDRDNKRNNLNILQKYLPNRIFQKFGIPTYIYLVEPIGIDYVYEKYNFMISYGIVGVNKINGGYYHCFENPLSRDRIESIIFISKGNDVKDDLEIIRYGKENMPNGTEGLPRISNSEVEKYYSSAIKDKTSCLYIGDSIYQGT
jgi:hypothetical protein